MGDRRESSLSPVYQEILDAIEENRVLRSSFLNRLNSSSGASTSSHSPETNNQSANDSRNSQPSTSNASTSTSSSSNEGGGDSENMDDSEVSSQNGSDGSLSQNSSLPDTVVDSLNSSFTSNFSANTDDTVPYSQDRDSSPDRDIMSPVPPVSPNERREDNARANDTVDIDSDDDIQIISQHIPIVDLSNTQFDEEERPNRGLSNHDSNVEFIGDISRLQPIVEPVNLNESQSVMFVGHYHTSSPIDITARRRRRRRNLEAHENAQPYATNSRNNRSNSSNEMMSPPPIPPIPRNLAIPKTPVQPQLEEIPLLNMTQPDEKVKLQCPICLDSAVKKNPHTTLCGHIFCYDCIARCIDATKKCPVCKKNTQKKQIHRIYV